MVGTAPDFLKIPLRDVDEIASLWVRAGERQGLSPRTLQARREFVEKFLWFLRLDPFEAVGPPEIEEYLHYLRTGHTRPGGRWGNPRMTKPLRPVSICDYYRSCRGLFKWALKKGFIAGTPMDFVDPQRAVSEIKQALTVEQIERLLAAARRTSHSVRDVAIITLLYDTGIRASELIGLKVGDIDLKNGCFRVIGKGNKRRTVFFEQQVAETLVHYRKKVRRTDEEPLFIAEGGVNKGKELTRSGLLQLVDRIGIAAGVRVNVHQLRRTFATHILRNGASLNGVRDMLGHTSIRMTLVYCSLAESDLQEQHRAFSPADHIRNARGTARK